MLKTIIIALFTSVSAFGQSADLDGDGCVALTDFVLLAEQWGQCEEGELIVSNSTPAIVRCPFHEDRYYAYTALGDGRWVFRWQSRFLEDVTEHSFRVTASADPDVDAAIAVQFDEVDFT